MKRLSQQAFIEKSQKIHGDKYDYSKSIYVNDLTDVSIICKQHGEFFQKPRHHLKGSQCPPCWNERHSILKRSTTQQFIEKSQKIHGDKYDYSKSIYVDSKTKLHIVCIIHGIFEQTPRQHLSGIGCPRCSMEQCGINRRKDIKSFIDQCNIIHNNRYSYEKSEYKTTHTKIIITCPFHGDFLQKPNDHLTGYGCPKCGMVGGYNFAYFDKFPHQRYIQSNFYLLKIYDDNEQFVKIGITKHPVTVRASYLKHYKIEIIRSLKLPLIVSFVFEQTLKANLAHYTHNPTIDLGGGHTECFSLIVINNLIKIFDNINRKTYNTTIDLSSINSIEDINKIYDQFHRLFDWN